MLISSLIINLQQPRQSKTDMNLLEFKEKYGLLNVEIAKAIMRDEPYISKVMRHKICPSLMMALVIERVTKGLVQPRDLVPKEKFIKYFKKQQQVALRKFPEWYPETKIEIKTANDIH
jgi:hypothetical protein